MTRPTVKLILPSGEMVHKHHMVSVASMCCYAAFDFDITRVVWAHSSSVTIVRNNGAAAIHGHNQRPDYTLWLDSDIVIPRDTLHRLYAHGREIVGARYRRRTWPHDKLGHPLPYEGAEPKEGLLEMRTMPFGCMLIKTEVFEKFPDDQPVFFERYSGADVVSEDHVWCERARELGFRVYADMKLSRELSHIGTLDVNEDCAPLRVSRMTNEVNRLHTQVADLQAEIEKMKCTSPS